MFTTFTGKNISIFTLEVKDICLLDIAHSLALQCRFNGHCRVHYSVAEHSIRAANEASVLGIDPRYLLLHDAAEAYCGDIIRDIKPAIFDRSVESRIRDVIFHYFNLGIDYWNSHHHVIKKIDNIMLATEVRDVMAEEAKQTLSHLVIDPLDEVIVSWDWCEAEDKFIAKAEELGLRD